MIYYLVFITSALFIFLATLVQRKNRILTFFLIFLAIIILAILASLRDYSVGTDTINYNNFYYFAEVSSNIYTYYHSMHNLFGIEYGFSILTYIISLSHLSVHYFYFICECIIGINIVFVLFSLSQKIDVTLGWLTYCFIFYTLSFNVLRQSMALSIVLIAIMEVYKKHNVKAIILILLSYMFHSASLIVFMIFAFGFLLMKLRRKGQIFTLIIVFLLISIILSTTFKNFGSLGIFGDKYSQYFGQQYAGQQTIQSIWSTLAIRIPMILLALYSLIINRNNLHKNNLFIYTLIIMEAVMLPFQLISQAIGRIVLYFGISKIVGYPLILNQLKFKPLLAFIMKILFIFFLMILFYYQVIMNNNNMVYPYIISNDFY